MRVSVTTGVDVCAASVPLNTVAASVSEIVRVMRTGVGDVRAGRANLARRPSRINTPVSKRFADPEVERSAVARECVLGHEIQPVRIREEIAYPGPARDQNVIPHVRPGRLDFPDPD